MTGEEGEGMRESEDFHSLVWLAQLVQDLFSSFSFTLLVQGSVSGLLSVVYSYCCCVRVDLSRLANIHTHSLSLILHLHLHLLVWNGTLPLHIRTVLPYIAWYCHYCGVGGSETTLFS